MSTTGIIMALVLAAISVGWLMLPLMRASGTKSRLALTRKARDEVLTAYERVLAAIRDLDEDFQTGKLDDVSYQEERAERMQQGTILLQHLETLNMARLPVDEFATIPAETIVDDDAVEAIIARYVKQSQAPAN